MAINYYFGRCSYLIISVKYLQCSAISNQAANVGMSGDRICYIGNKAIRAKHIIEGGLCEWNAGDFRWTANQTCVATRKAPKRF